MASGFKAHGPNAEKLGHERSRRPAAVDRPELPEVLDRLGPDWTRIDHVPFGATVDVEHVLLSSLGSRRRHDDRLSAGDRAPVDRGAVAGLRSPHSSAQIMVRSADPRGP